MSTVTAPSNPQLFGTLKDTNASLLYGTGTKGPNATNPGSPYEDLGMRATDGDMLTYTATKTKNGFDNQSTFSKNNPDQELLSRDIGSGALTALDNGKKFTSDGKNTGDIFSANPTGKMEKIGNFNDKDLSKELTAAGMSKEAAKDFEKVQRTGSIQSLSAARKDFSSMDRKDFNLLKNQSLADEQNPATGGNSPNPIADSIKQLLGYTVGTPSAG